MATKTLKARVEIDGEKEYKQALSELNQGNKVLASEMKLLQEQYKGSESSMEALRARSDVLERQLLQQKDKVQTLREALKNAATQSGESSKQTQNWQIQLNNAERDQIKLERALEETNKALDNQGQEVREDAKEMTGLGDTVDQVANKLGVHIPEGARNALNGMKGLSVGTVAAMSAAAGGVAAVIKTVKELHDLTVESAKWADDLITRAAQTGLDASTLQGLDNASKYIDFEGIDQSLVKLTDSMDKAREGAEKQNTAFETLGVSVVNTDGALRSNWETFMDVIDSLGEVQNATERDTIANDLFGQSYSELKPLIDAGTEALKEYMDQAQDTGLVLTESQVKVLGEVDDAHQKLTDTIEGEKRKIAAEWAPASIASMDAFAKATKKVGDAVIDSGLIENVATIVEHGANLFQTATAIADKIPDWLKPIESAAKKIEYLNKIIAGTADLLGLTKKEMVGYNGLGSDVAGATWKSDVQAWVTAGGTIITPENINDIDKATGKVTREFYSGSFVPGDSAYSYGHMSEEEIQRLLKRAGYNAAGTDNWRGGLTWLGESGPELVQLPRGSQIYSNQESRQIATAAPTDTRRLEQQQGETIEILRAIQSELAARRILERMR